MSSVKTAMPAEGFVRLPHILSFLSISKSCFYKGICEGRFPAPVKLTPKTSVWRAAEIRKIAEGLPFMGKALFTATPILLQKPVPVEEKFRRLRPMPFSPKDSFSFHGLVPWKNRAASAASLWLSPQNEPSAASCPPSIPAAPAASCLPCHQSATAKSSQGIMAVPFHSYGSASTLTSCRSPTHWDTYKLRFVGVPFGRGVPLAAPPQYKYAVLRCKTNRRCLCIR